MTTLSPARETLQKHDVLTRSLRRKIVEGRLRPGERLPTREELARELGLSLSTVQRALQRLEREKFITSRRRVGTMVAEVLPHQTHIAVVCRWRPSNSPETWPVFADLLCRAAEDMDREENDQRLFVFHGVGAEDSDESLAELCELVRHHRLAGLIFVNLTANQFEGTPLLEDPTVARAAFSYRHSDTPGNVAYVSNDIRSFLDRAAGRFRQCGVRRVAVLNTGGFLAPLGQGGEPSVSYLMQWAAEQGLDLPRHRVQFADVHRPYAIAAIARLLCHDPATRPEGLLLVDDYLAQPVVNALGDCGLRPDELCVISHCNFPQPPATAAPVTWLGFDMRHAMKALVEQIDAQLQSAADGGGRTNMMLSADRLIPAVFEEEIHKPVL